MLIPVFVFWQSLVGPTIETGDTLTLQSIQFVYDSDAIEEPMLEISDVMDIDPDNPPSFGNLKSVPF